MKHSQFQKRGSGRFPTARRLRHRRLPAGWEAYRRPRSSLIKELTLFLLLGSSAGLAFAQWQAPPAVVESASEDPFAGQRPETPNPWAASEESRRILAAQEGAPAAALATVRTRSLTTRWR